MHKFGSSKSFFDMKNQITFSNPNLHLKAFDHNVIQWKMEFSPCTMKIRVRCKLSSKACVPNVHVYGV